MHSLEQGKISNPDGIDRLPLSPWFGLKESSLVLFIFAFAYKWIPGVRDIPGDLTVIFMITTSVFGVHYLFRSKVEVWQFLSVLTIILVSVISLLSIRYVANELALITYFFLTIPAFVLPLLLIRSEKDLSRLTGAIIGIILIVSIFLLWNYLQGQSLRLYLLREGAQVIHPGRILGAQIILFVILTFTGKVRIPVGLIIIGVTIILLLNIGNRQGILGAILTLIVWFTVLRGKRFRWSIFLTSIAVFALAINFLPTENTYVESNALNRYIVILTEGVSYDASSQARLSLFDHTITLIYENPFGIGPHSLMVGGEYTYPHNFFLEAFLSFGWINGTLVSAILLFSLWRAFKLARSHSNSLAYTIFFLLFLHWFFLSNVSGDFNVNRILFAFVGIGIALENNPT